MFIPGVGCIKVYHRQYKIYTEGTYISQLCDSKREGLQKLGRKHCGVTKASVVLDDHPSFLGLLNGEDQFIGEAVCSIKDRFNKKVGARIAIGRALKAAGLGKRERQKILHKFFEHGHNGQRQGGMQEEVHA